MSKGWLRNGNEPFDLRQVQRCGAQSKRTGLPCQQPAMANGRCRLHGGWSTGPRTKEGRDRQRIAATKTGAYAGPGHPIYGERPGPLWPGLKDVRRQTREAMKRLGWKQRTDRSPQQARDPATGRFRMPPTQKEMQEAVARVLDG